jgi:CheY-like chemotaxis protein
MSGEEFIRALRERPRLARIPIVVITAGEPSHVGPLGVAAVVRKPFDFQTLLAIVVKLFKP